MALWDSDEMEMDIDGDNQWFDCGRAGDMKLTKNRNTLLKEMQIQNHTAITIARKVVVAVPKGLLLAVTLTLAYSMRKMMADKALMIVVAA